TSTPHASLVAMMPLPLWRRGARISVARGELALTDLEIDAAGLELRHDVRLHYYACLHAERELVIGKEALANEERLVDIAKTRFEQGDVPEVEVKLTA